MADCDHCPSKGECSSQDSCTIHNNPYNNVKKVIGVMSGKGGVGKSTVTALLAKELQSRGFSVGVLDADITGPSIPRLLGVKSARIEQNELGLLPAKTKEGIAVMSLNLLIEDERQPVIWRGPIISGTVKQFWEDVFWGDLDYLIIDMPPGTGDVALTVMQSIPVSGMIIVSVPQDMVSMIVAKAVNMVKALKIKLLGIVQNMSFVECPDCSKKIRIFGEGGGAELLESMGLPLLGELPMKASLAAMDENGIENPDVQIQAIFKSIADKVVEAADEN
jgi:Mrp family chromosome partitioning ATPase